MILTQPFPATKGRMNHKFAGVRRIITESADPFEDRLISDGLINNGDFSQIFG